MGGELGAVAVGKLWSKWQMNVNWFCPSDEQQRGSWHALLPHLISQATFPAKRLGSPHSAYTHIHGQSTQADGFTSALPTLSSTSLEVFLTVKVTDANAQEGHAGVQWGLGEPPCPAWRGSPGSRTAWVAMLEGRLTFSKPFNSLKATGNR